MLSTRLIQTFLKVSKTDQKILGFPLSIIVLCLEIYPSNYGFKTWNIALSMDSITSEISIIFRISIMITIKRNIAIYKTAFYTFITFEVEKHFIIQLLPYKNFRNLIRTKLNLRERNQKESRTKRIQFCNFRNFYFQSIACFVPILIFSSNADGITSTFRILYFKGFIKRRIQIGRISFFTF